jgi:hypothetical protein
MYVYIYIYIYTYIYQSMYVCHAHFQYIQSKARTCIIRARTHTCIQPHNKHTHTGSTFTAVENNEFQILRFTLTRARPMQLSTKYFAVLNHNHMARIPVTLQWREHNHMARILVTLPWREPDPMQSCMSACERLCEILNFELWAQSRPLLLLFEPEKASGYTHVHIYIQTYIHTYIHTYIQRREVVQNVFRKFSAS